MRLQSAIFQLEETLLRPGTTSPREGADKVLAILKMEGVWMYAVSAQSTRVGEQALQDAGLSGYFRGVLAEDVARCPYTSGTMFERAMRRLHSEKADTVVFAGHLESIRNAVAAGFRTVAVRGAADEAEWQAMKRSATEALERYEDYLAQ